MESASEELFKGFVELCEKLVSDAYIITDGRRVLTATLDHSVATKLCQVMIDRTGEPNWRVASIANGIELAYRCGYDQACRDFKDRMSGEEAQDAAPELEGESRGENSELRNRELRGEEESGSIHPLHEE
jgi:hypothetical protein